MKNKTHREKHHVLLYLMRKLAKETDRLITYTDAQREKQLERLIIKLRSLRKE